MVDEILLDLRSKMQKAVDGLGRELAAIRTGRANPAIVENIIVDYHGVPVPLHQIASISTPEANLITIQPWERGSLRSIEKAVLKSNVGINPLNDGAVIRMVIPPLTEERRTELAKLVSKKVEERRVMLRNIRRDCIGGLREMGKNKEISQDELKKATRQVDGICDSFVDEANEIGQQKEKEIKEI